MATVIVDNREIELPEGQQLNCIQAAALAGVEIPHYCFHPGLSVVGSCRMCLVEIGKRDRQTGHITMFPKLQPACNTPATDGTVIVTQSEKVQQARAMVEEDLLLRHPIDCPTCDKAGECRLQDYHFRYGQNQRRAELQPFHSRRQDLGDVWLFVDRCIMCTRCVRFVREVAGTGELLVLARGIHEEIAVLPGYPLNNKLSGNVVDLCPVGALADKDFLYKQRVWFLQSHAGVCPQCAIGCSIWIDENQDHIWRIRPRENPHVNRWWICNDGRYGYHQVHDRRRLLRPRRRTADGWEEFDWQQAAPLLRQALQQAGRLAAVLSPFLTVEEAYLLALLVRRIDPEALLGLGPIPRIGQDEHFPGGFTILAEKCPNRRGVEAILSYFMKGRIFQFEELLSQLEPQRIRGLWISGGYKAPVAPVSHLLDQSVAERLEGLALLVVHDLFPSPVAERADFLLPAAAWPEREGSYVNWQDRLQSFRRAIRPPRGVLPEGWLLWQMHQRAGRFDASMVLDEIAQQLTYFAPVVYGVPDVGLDLKVGLLATSSPTQKPT
ncbi:MAG: molybdopterin-dependent oxidoreductase [Thermoguttaceae bacterium]|nr:molybdopterin-dependent oxidoreductase [Thermoguttaceae bacterium]MDW8039752.1 molybdopterin-dependent oxidoreductase [Thermoguttaceae bacterium]